MIKEAVFSECGKYRYNLTRIWDDSKKIAMCIGLNPSKAGVEKNDATIRILIRTLTALNYGGLRMTNLYAFIATNPKILLAEADKQGANDIWLSVTAMTCQDIIYCWGSFNFIDHRVKQIKSMFPDGKCFGKNDNGSPIHPMAIMWQGLKIDALKKF